MIDNLNVAILSLDIVPEDPEANIHLLETSLQKMHKGVDVVILPELFSTGFVKDKEKISILAESCGGETITKLHTLADKYECAISGSYLCKVASTVLNRGFFIEPGGEETFYDKRHLFSLSPEKDLLNAGIRQCPIIRYRSWNISMIICYDLRFPVWCRNTENKYDLMIVPANWPKVRGYAWEHLLIARAIENQSFVIGANRSGEDKYGVYTGMSEIYSPTGEPIGKEEDNITYATLTKKKVADIRHYLPVIKDADTYTINL